MEGLDDDRHKTVECSNPAENDHLAILCRNKKVGERTDRAAVEYMDYCANIGDVSGQLGMGHLYHQGAHGVPRDRRLAKHWFRAAAHKGDGMGHANLGLMEMREGHYGTAIKSLRRATKLNDPSGWAGLGYAFLYGAGVPRSDERAAKAIWLAAKSGHLDSIYNLGVLTLEGRGLPQSVRAACRRVSPRDAA